MGGCDTGTASEMKSVFVFRAPTLPTSGSKFSRFSTSWGDWVQDPRGYENPWTRNPLRRRAGGRTVYRRGGGGGGGNCSPNCQV